MLVGMGELCDQVLLQSLPTDGRLDAGPSPCTRGWWIGWVVDPRCFRHRRMGSISLQMDRVDSISVGASAHMSDIAFKQLEVSVRQKLFSQPARKELKGPFGQIIADYKKKVEKIRGKNGGRLLFLFAAKSFFLLRIVTYGINQLLEN